MNPLVEINGLHFSYKEMCLFHEMNLSFERNTSYAIIGMSGVGKSTLLHLLAGYIKPSAGTVRMDEMQVPHQGNNIAFMLQDLGLFPWQTVYEAVAMPLKLTSKEGKHVINKRVSEIVEEVGLHGLGHKYPHQLSGGQRQRVALARTLISSPALLLMDEPTSTLDEMTKEQIQDIIRQEVRKRKMTFVFVTHDMKEAALLGQEILIMKKDGVIKRLKNPHYHQENPREDIHFYQFCLEIRKLLHEDGNKQ